MLNVSAKKMAYSLLLILFSFTVLQPLNAEAAIAFVQKISNTTSSARSLALTLPAKVTAGNLLVVSVSGWPNLPASTAVTDSLGNSYAPAGTVLVSQGAYSALYYAWNVKGGTDTVTFTTVNSGGQISMVVSEFSGVDTVSPLDKTAGATGTGKTPSSGAMTPTAAGSLIIGSGTHNGSTVTTAGSGFTMIDIPTEDSDTHQPLAVAYRVSSTTQQSTATFNLAVAYPWTQNGALFKPSGTPVTDTTAPTVTAFTIPATSTSLTVPVASFTATDNIAVSGYLLTESSAAPSASASGWSATAPASYTFAAVGNKTLYAWAKDAAGNVSAGKSASVVVTVSSSDSTSIWSAATVPGITDFGPDYPVELGVKFKSDTSGYITGIRFYKASANTGIHVGNLWSSSGSRLATATFTGEGASGWQQVNFSSPVAISANTVYVASYHTSVGHFSVDRNFFTGGSIDNPPLHALSESASGGNGVFAYSSASAFPNQSWSSSNYWVDVVFSSDGTTPPPATAGPEPAGWYAGDMHVHRSCGGSPESVASVFGKMDTHKLSLISLLADMGNGEVQNSYTDLPLVTGRDASNSTSGKILRWDAEWHWDPVYWEYPHQALGGHIVALGLSEAHQIWEEYTFPIFDWAHQQNAIAGFAHMQYLDNTIPQDLTCCTPLEYPVEVALGASDFISEDVLHSGSRMDNMYADSTIQAYYRLLNCGFRPGLAAGTDYPCNGGADPGALLTYVKTSGGTLDYPAWVDGIAKGKTVVSRNGHREFLDLKVNTTAAPGDEIRLTGGGTVQVGITWSAIESLTGTIELVHNGVVVASKQATAASGAPVTLSASVNFTTSGWLAARRMGSDGHQLHTAAVFVIVDNAPIRASKEDALFYVSWMDNLLEKTSPGGAWNVYFPTKLEQAQSRYRSAREIYSRIAVEAGGTTDVPDNGSIYTNQVPDDFVNDNVFYELGTRFRTDTNGQVTQVRLYTGPAEAGTHTVRIWRMQDATVVAGPYDWNVTSGTTGWRSFTLPVPLSIVAGTDYIVSVSTGSDKSYAASSYGFNAPIVNGHLQTFAGSGLYSESAGAMPSLSWQNSGYFRDVSFLPAN